MTPSKLQRRLHPALTRGKVVLSLGGACCVYETSLGLDFVGENKADLDRNDIKFKVVMVHAALKGNVTLLGIGNMYSGGANLGLLHQAEKVAQVMKI